MTDRIDDVGAENLAKSCHAYTSRTPTHKVATLAYIQAYMAQCAVQVLVTTLLRRNMVSDTDLQRMLAEAYDEAGNTIRTQMQLVAPAAAVTRPKNGS